MKIVGMQSVVSTTKAGEETSHAVYPRASNVFRIPPLGKERCIRFLLDEQFAGKTFNHISVPSPNSMKPSCFSAVPSVRGWNQCV